MNRFLGFLVTALAVWIGLALGGWLPWWLGVLVALLLVALVWLHPRLRRAQRRARSVRHGTTSRHAWRVTESGRAGRFDAFVYDKRGGTKRAEFVGYFQSPEDAAEAAIESATTLDDVTQEGS